MSHRGLPGRTALEPCVLAQQHHRWHVEQLYIPGTPLSDFDLLRSTPNHRCLVIHIQSLPRPNPSDLVILEAYLLSSIKLSLVLHDFLFVQN